MRTEYRTVIIRRGGASLRPRCLPVLITMSLVFTMSGCSTVSDSLSDSFSKSVSSPFKWSSGSSSGSSEESKETYQGDIRSYAEVSSRSNSEVSEIVRGLAAIGEKHGITNWEADMATYAGIGEGLAKAKATQHRVDAYKSALSQGDYTRSAAIQKGYEQTL